MPVLRCQKGGKPGFKWGREGVCFTESKDGLTPKEQAARVGRAIAAEKALAVGLDAAGGFLVATDKVFPTIAEVSPELFVEMSVDQLAGFHERLHHLWAQLGDQESGETDEGDLTKEDIFNAHVVLASELAARDRPIPEGDDITQAGEDLGLKFIPSLVQGSRALLERAGFIKNITAKEAQAWLSGQLETAKDAMIVPGYVSIVGSATGEGSSIGDVDLHMKEELSQVWGWRESVMLLARKLFDPKKKLGLNLHLVGSVQGPHLAEGESYIPLFDLVLRPRKEIERVFKAGIETEKHGIIQEAYQQHLKYHGFSLEDNPSKREKVAESGEAKLHRVSDGYGEFYFLQNGSDVQWVAQKIPNLSAYALSEHATQIIDVDTVMTLGWENKAWDEMLARIFLGDYRPEDEGGTRSSRARKLWKENWHQSFPESGEGRFVYHHHWRGLDNEDILLDDEGLMKTENRVHGDLRFSFKGALWGFTVFLGKTTHNRDLENHDGLIDLTEGHALEGAFKGHHPKEWLTVGRTAPFVGPDQDKFEKFFVKDEGTYRMGVWEQGSFEVFLDGDKLKGRHQFLFATNTSKRTWLVTKPEDQKPFAETKDLEDVLKEQRHKNREFLVWAQPGDRPKLFNLKESDVDKRFPTDEFGATVSEAFALMEEQGRQFTQDEAVYEEPSPDSSRTCGACRYFLRDEASPIGRCQIVDGPIAWFGTSKRFISAESESAASFAVQEKAHEGADYIAKRGTILKVEEDGKFVLAPVLVPEEEDLEGDLISVEEIERAAHDFMADFQNVGLMHETIFQSKDVVMVENYIQRANVTINGVKVKKGTWMGGFRVLNVKLQQAIKDGQITGVSIGGVGTRTPEEA